MGGASLCIPAPVVKGVDRRRSASIRRRPASIPSIPRLLDADEIEQYRPAVFDGGIAEMLGLQLMDLRYCEP